MRLRYRYLDLRRPNAAAEHDPAAQGGVRRAPVLRRAGLPRDRDADPDEVHARRGARLPGAEPRPPGRVLRAAAVAADLQADPDDRGHGPLLPDREVLPRRGPARRSAARVHAGGPRDLVRDRGPGVLDPRAADGAPDGAGRARGAASVPPDAVRRSDRDATAPTSRTCVPGWSCRICRSRSRRRASRSSAARSRPAARCAASSCPAARAYSRKDLDNLDRRSEAARRRRAGLGAPGRGRRSRVRR